MGEGVANRKSQVKGVLLVGLLLVGLSLPTASLPVTFKDCWSLFTTAVADCQERFTGDALKTCLAGAETLLSACVKAVPGGGTVPKVQVLSITVTRAEGKPVLSTYPLVAEAPGTYHFNILNGNLTDKSTMVSSARIRIKDGPILFTPNDFNKNIPVLNASVPLEAGFHMIEIEVNGQPASYLGMIVTDADITGEF